MSAQNKRTSAYKPLADINMTPFIDVMMVLLIIFMVTAPLMTVGVKVDLPKADASEVRPKEEPFTITVNKDGDLYVGQDKVAITELIARLNNRRGDGSKEEQRIFIRGDRQVNYGQVMKVMSVLTKAGFTKIAMIAERDTP